MASTHRAAGRESRSWRYGVCRQPLRASGALARRCAHRRHRRRVSGVPPQWFRIAAAAVSAVNSVSVAWTSSGFSLPASCRSSQARLNCSRPQLFGGGKARRTGGPAGGQATAATPCPGRGPRAIRVVRASQVVLRPGVQQHVAGAAIEAVVVASPGARSVRLAMPPRLRMTRCASGVAEQRVVESRHQRRALAAGGDVAAAEVGHDGDAGQFGKQCRVVELQRVAVLGRVADRLPMAADRTCTAVSPRRLSRASARPPHWHKLAPGGWRAAPHDAVRRRRRSCSASASARVWRRRTAGSGWRTATRAGRRRSWQERHRRHPGWCRTSARHSAPQPLVEQGEVGAANQVEAGEDALGLLAEARQLLRRQAVVQSARRSSVDCDASPSTRNS